MGRRCTTLQLQTENRSRLIGFYLRDRIMQVCRDLGWQLKSNTGKKGAIQRNDQPKPRVVMRRNWS